MHAVLSALLALASSGGAGPDSLQVIVDGTSRAFPLPASSAWSETWSAGPIDVWLAARKQGAGCTVEYELSARARVHVDSLTIHVPGYADRPIAVGMDWPAGRSLCGRAGEELPLLPDWPTRKQTFGPLEIELPKIEDVPAQTAWAAAKLTGLRKAIAARQGGFAIDDSLDAIYAGEPGHPAWIGPWACWVAPDPGPGVPGGSGIYHCSGWQDNEAYARLACEVEALAMGRMWCFHNADGSWYSVDQFRDAQQLSPNCASEANIKPPAFAGPDPLWRPISLSHYPRVLRYCQAAYEMTGSPLARRHLIQLAESARLQFTEDGVIETGASWIAWNLSSWEVLAQAHPHTGVIAPGRGCGWDRNHGWMLWSAAEAKKAGMRWTRGWADWAQRMVDAMTTSQMPNGLIGRLSRDEVSHTEDISAAMHEALLGMGLLAIHEQAGIAIPTILPDHAHALYQVAPRGSYHGQVGPLHYLACAPRERDEPYPTITHGFSEPTAVDNPGDPIVVESYLAAVYALIADPSYRNCALQFGVPAPTAAVKRARMQATKDLMLRNWQAYLLAQLQ
jgi:hypothetical protein